MLNFLAKIIYKKYQPKILIVSGTAGKTSIIYIIKSFLENKINIYATSYHRDHKKAIPLTFILEKEYKPFLNFLKALKLIFFKQTYPELIILEFGFEDKKLVDYWLKSLKTNYLIIPSLGKIPAFSEIFAGPENMKKRIKNLAKNVSVNGYIFVNNDDISCIEVTEDLETNKIYFGFSEDSDFRGVDIELICNLETTPTICGTALQIVSKFGKKRIFLRNLFGKGIIYSCLASTAFLFHLGFDLEEIGNFLEKIPGLPHRLNLIKTNKGFYILDDSLHLSQASFWQAIDIFEKIPIKRKIILLGDCLDAGKYALDFHFEIGEALSKVSDFIITFGLRAKYSLDSAISYGFEETKTRHFYPNQSHELLHFLENLLMPGDLILITGDKRLNLHKIVDYLR